MNKGHFLHACPNCYHAALPTPQVREVRRAVLLNRGREDFDSDTEWENPEVAESEVASTRPDSTTQEIDEYPDISGRKANKQIVSNTKCTSVHLPTVNYLAVLSSA